MRYNLSKIRRKTAYNPQEIGQLLKVNRKTIFRWFKEGLVLLDSSQNPKLVMGCDLKAFIQAKRDVKQVKLNWNEFYCLRCRKAVLGKRGSERTEKTGKSIGSNNRDQEMICAKCKECDGSVARLL
ncbi:hypothetical protein KKG19_05425 [Patescibacteria group bacterium]|nr:hypothetical protein [Patescibacteria group bacterium]